MIVKSLTSPLAAAAGAAVGATAAGAAVGASAAAGAAVGAAAAGAAVGASAAGAGAAVGAAAGAAAPPQAASNAAPLAVSIPRRKFRRERRFVSSDICVLLCMNFTRQSPQHGLQTTSAQLFPLGRSGYLESVHVFAWGMSAVNHLPPRLRVTDCKLQG